MFTRNWQNTELELLIKRTRYKWQCDFTPKTVDRPPTTYEKCLPDTLLSFFRAKKIWHWSDLDLYDPDLNQLDDVFIIHNAISHVNKRLRLHCSIVRISLVVLCVLMAIVPFLSETLPMLGKTLLLLFAGVILGISQWYQVWDKKFSIDKFLRRHAERQLDKVVCDRGIHSKMNIASVYYKNGKFLYDIGY